MVNVVPAPGSLLTVIVPEFSSIKSRQSASPSPPQR